MASPVQPTAPPSFHLSPDERLKRKQRGNDLAAQLRRLADHPDNTHFKPHLYAVINTILIDAARTPARDRQRVLKTLFEFGGGEIEHIAEYAKLPAVDVAQILASLIADRQVYRASEHALFFLYEQRA